MESFKPGYPQCASLGDLQRITDNLEKYSIPKLDVSAVAMLKNVLVLFEQKDRISNIVVGVRLVVGVLNRSVECFTYTIDEWDSMASGIGLLFRRVFDCMVFNPTFLSSEQNVKVINKTTETFMVLVDRSPKLKTLMMEHNGVKILQLVSWEVLSFVDRKTLLYLFKKHLKTLSSTQRKDLINKSYFLKSSFALMLPYCGSYEFQEYLIELLLRLAVSQKNWKNMLKSWFTEFPTVASAVDLLDVTNYEISCRKFLNAVNESQPCEGRVHSLPCLNAVVSGSVELLKPQGYEDLWLDCSPRGGEIELLIDGGAGNWARVTVEFANVRSIKCTNRLWKQGPDNIECCQLVIEVQPPVSIPLETEISFTELRVVLKKDLKFQELEDSFFKTIYAYFYEPEPAHRTISTSCVRSESAPSSLIASSSSRKTSLANVTLSSIERDRSNVTFGSSTSGVKLPRFASVFAQKHITASTPLREKVVGKKDVKRKVMRKNEEIDKPDNLTEDGSVSVGFNPRTSVSDQVTLTVHRDLKTDCEQSCKQITSNSLCAPTQVDENDMESNEFSFYKLMELTNHKTLHSNVHNEISVYSANGLGSMETNEKITLPEESLMANLPPHSGMEVVDLITSVSEGLSEGPSVLQDNAVMNHGSVNVPECPPRQNSSSLVDFKALHIPQLMGNYSVPEISPRYVPRPSYRRNEVSDSSENILESMENINRNFTLHESLITHSPQRSTTEVVDLITPVSYGSGLIVPQDDTVMNHGGFIVPKIPPSQSVFGAHHSSLVDFKSLNHPQPVNNNSNSELSPRCLPFKKKFFGKFRRPHADITESDASLSSCSTKVSRKHFSGLVQIWSPTFNPTVKPSGKRKIGEGPMDPFSFVDGDESRRSQENVLTPTSTERQKRKLFTPGKDDVLCSYNRDPPNSRPMRVSCVLDSTKDKSKGRKKPRRKTQRVDTGRRVDSVVVDKPETNGIRKGLRTRKKVNYFIESGSEYEMSNQESKVKDKTFQASLSRKVEPLRSEVVATIPPIPSCSAPYLPSDDDRVVLSPPLIPIDVVELEPVEISPPPPQIEMDILSSPVNLLMSMKRKQGKNKVNLNRAKKKRGRKNIITCLSNTESVPSTEVSHVSVSETGKAEMASPPSNVPTSELNFIATTENTKELPAEKILRNPRDAGSESVKLNVLCAATLVEADQHSEEKTLSCPAMVPQSSCPLPPIQQVQPMNTPKEIGERPFGVESSSTAKIEDSQMLSKIDTICHQIWSHVKTYVNGVKSDDRDFVESVEVNLSTCLEVHKEVMKTIHEEGMNIARSAANVQSAYERAVASFDVVQDMMKVIESVHRESSIASSIRNNDPRSFSQLRQQIVKLMNETLCQKSHVM